MIDTLMIIILFYQLFLRMFQRKIKPNLIDNALPKRIISTLNPPDQWGPTKGLMRYVFDEYVVPNKGLIICLIILALLLLYRYRSTKNRRDEIIILPEKNDPNETDYLLEMYKTTKEYQMEPKIKTAESSRIEMARPKLAYPIFPGPQ